MTRTLQVIAGTVAASIVGLAASAQEMPNSPTDARGDRRTDVTNPRHQGRLNEAAKASDVIGMPVTNDQGDKLGKIKEVAIDLQSGRITEVILATGGMAGVGDTYTALPPCLLHSDSERKHFFLNADKEKVKNAPKFEFSQWANQGSAERLKAEYAYYGEEAKGQSIDSSEIPDARLTQVQRASKLLGDSVRNGQNEKVGKLDNLLLDLPSGRVVAAIVSSGGFLGMDGELSAVPPSALRYVADQNTLQINASKEMLSSAPHFKSDQWPDFSQPGYAVGVYSAYHADPYFTTNASRDGARDASHDVDDTAQNVRDRDNRTVTPLDQGNSKSDISTTAQIRKQVVSSKDMSTDAKNVKIITMNGRVTLRGPVKTEDEKRAIGDIANRVARPENVDNQIEVKIRNTNN